MGTVTRACPGDCVRGVCADGDCDRGVWADGDCDRGGPLDMTEACRQICCPHRSSTNTHVVTATQCRADDYVEAH
jgi:hypothetical protein